MRNLLTILLTFVISSMSSDGILFHNQLLISQPEKPKPIEVSVTATMYYAVPSQCDDTPFVTAANYHINPAKASKQRFIALSRNLLKRWKGQFNYGDSVRISGAGDKDGTYKIVDTMNSRFKNRIDFLETVGTKKYKYNNVKLVKV